MTRAPYRSVVGLGALAGVLLIAPWGFGDGDPSPRYTEKELLQNWALARCLSRSFPGSPLESDAAASAAGYLEKGSLGADAYEEIAKLADQFLARTYGSYSGEKLQTMKCIDLFHSPELDRSIRRFVKKGGSRAGGDPTRPKP